MSEGIGGSVIIMIVAIFLLVVSGYLAFSVTYNKAFRVKNKIINILEQQEGCNSSAKDKIREAINEAGYHAKKPNINNSEYQCYDEGYCVKWNEKVKNGKDSPNTLRSGYYDVVTSVYVDIPIINKIMPYMQVLQVTGSTITIYPGSGTDAKCP